MQPLTTLQFIAAAAVLQASITAVERLPIDVRRSIQTFRLAKLTANVCLLSEDNYGKSFERKKNAKSH
jgi:hypothetical protein